MTAIAIVVALAAPAAAPSERGEAAKAAADAVRIYVITDLEGPAGVHSWSQTRVDGPAKRQAMAWLTDEVNAAVEGILQAAPRAAVDVWDGHGNGGILREKLHRRARYLRAEGPPRALVEGAYTAVFFVGQHAMAGTPFAPLAHTYSSRSIAYYKLNGLFVGEFGARTALAGSRGIPVIFIAGDDKAVLEARAWVPEIVGVAVKRGRGLQAADSLPHDEACRRIREGAAKAIRRRAGIPPVRLEPPFRLEIRYYEPREHGPDRAGRRAIDPRTIELEAEDLAKLPI